MPAQMEVDLAKDLAARQEAHSTCLSKARADGIDINEACSLTAMQAAEAWRDWSRYRAPFKTAETEAQVAALKPAKKE